MGDGRAWSRSVLPRPLVLLVSLALLSGLLSVVNPVQALAAGTVLFQNSFNNRTVDGTGTLTKPAAVSGAANLACLTASGNTSTPPLLSCPSSNDTQGNGNLRLTAATGDQIGGVYGGTSFPTSSGLDVTFNTYQYGGGGADGMSFVLAAVDPTNPVAPAAIGPGGGSLGYSPAGSLSGLPNAYLGVGLDVYGNFSSPSFQGSGCATRANITAQAPGAVVVRGPGNASTGYCGLATSYAGTTASRVTLRSTLRATSVVPVQVLINPGTTSFTSDTGQSVAAGTYKVVFTPVGGAAKTLTGTLPTVPTGLYTSNSYLNSSGYPKQLAFGFIGSTGGTTDFHEADEVKVVTFNAVAQLAVATTSYVGTSPAAGDPVSYVVTPSVQSGVDVTRPVTMTQTVPAGVTPVGAYGNGWTCAAPSGQTVTCTTSASSFTNGTTLPPINVVGIVTGSSVTPASVLSGSTSAVSSENANPASAFPTAGTVPAAPSGLTLSSTAGPVAGGGPVTISGTNLTTATAVEIGTTAEQQAGTPVVLLPCSSVITTACFTVSGSTLVVSSWPARATPASVGVRVVTLGVQGTTTYTYAARPSTPVAPTATPGTSSATVTWTAPAANGSTITGYTVTPYLGGVAQTPLTYDASTTTRTLTGLTPGGSYTFTVTAVNAYGTSAASPASTAVVPYTLPGAPTVSSVSAGDSSATLSWTAPTSNGFTPVTGYVVTPYVGAVAQTPVTFSGTSTTQTVTGLTPGTSYTFRVAAVNAAGTGPASATSAAVVPNASPSLTFPAPPPGEVGAAYSRQLTVNDGTAPYAWSVSTGSLPPGLSLAPGTGLLSGTPSTAGSYAFTVLVTDASGQTASRSVTITVAPRPSVAFSPAAGEVGVAYNQQPTLTGGTGPFVWAVTAGSLPAGLSLDTTTGAVSGTPTAAGTYSVTLQVTDAFNQTASRTVSIVLAAQPTLGLASSAAPQVGVAYSNSLPVTGGTAPFTWSVTAGSLPAGLSLDAATGALTGTPTTAGAYSATITVVDGFGQSASRTFAGTVTAGPLVITKTANASSTVAGASVVYTITVANTGPSAFSGVSLTDPLAGVLDDATYGGGASATTGTVSYANGTLAWTGNLAAGATATITYAVTVANPVTGNQVLANTVTSGTLGSNCASGSTDARCTATVTVSGLSIVKTADVASTTPGGTVRFTVVATNTGRTAYVGATFTDSLADVLDDAAYDGDARATSGSLSYANPSLTWTGNLAAGAAVTVTYTVTVADPDPGNRALRGTVVSPTAGSTCPSSNPAASCTVAVPVLVPALAITDTAAVSTTTPGSSVTHTVTLANTGQTAYTGATATIALAGALDDARYDGGATSDTGSVGYSAGTRTLTWTGDLPVGTSARVTFVLTVDNPDNGDRTLTTRTTSSVAGSTCPPGGTAAACTSSVQVLVPALSITKTSDVSQTTPGSVVRYTVLVANTGQTPYTGATFTDALAGVLDDATYGRDAAATSGTVGFAGSSLSWSGDLAVGASATITYSVTVLDPDPGNRTLTSSVSSTTPFASCPPGSTAAGCTSAVPVLLPGLRLELATDVATTIPGSTVRYTVTATNTGQTAYTGAAATVDLAGVLDDATYGNDWRASAGGLTQSGNGSLVWTFDLPVGASATVTGSFTVQDPDPGDRSLVAAVASDAAGSTCPTTATAGCRSTVAVLTPGLTVTKTAGAPTVLPGGRVTYTITVVNDGQSVQPAASVTDSLARVLTDATYDGNAAATTGTVTYDAATLAWSGSLAVGARATITYSVTVRDPDPGDKMLTNTVVSPTPGSNCASGSTDPRCTTTVDVLVPQLTIVKSVDPQTTVPGGVVTSTVKVTNSGMVPYTGATFAVALAGVLDDASLSGTPTASTGSVSVSGSTLTWTGNLAVAASATITYAVRVSTADVGDDRLVDAVTSTTRGSTCPAGGTDPRCGSSVPVARLQLAQAYTQTSTTPGSVVNLRATFTNTGQVPYTGITVTSPSGGTTDDANPNGDQTATSGSLVLTATGITWTGDIAVGQTVTVTGTLTVQDPDTGDKLLTGTLVTTAPGSNCASGSGDPACTSRLPVLVPQLSITKTADSSFVVPGGTARYTVTIANTGQTPYTGAQVTDVLTGVLDDATYNGDATASRGTLAYTSPTLTWTGDLPVGTTATVVYSATATTAGTGDKAMVNTVASSVVGSTCPPASSSPACRVTVPVRTPALTVVKTADALNATLGSTVGYTITVTNTGQTDYASASFTDPLTDVLDDATYTTAASATRGTVTYASSTVSWSGALAVGQSATITYGVKVKNPNTGNGTMVNTVTSPTAGSTCRSGSTDTRCTSTVAVINSTTTIVVNQTADVAYATPGSKVTYTIKVTNTAVLGLSLATSVTESLSDVLDDATYNNDVSASTGTVSVTGTTLSWSTGVLALNSTTTITYSVTVKPTSTGNQVLAGTLASSAPAASSNCSTAPDARCSTTVPVARLQLSQSYTETSTTPGSLVHLTATFRNTGGYPFSGISVTSPSADTVDDANVNGDQTASSGTLALTSTGITWTGNLPVGGVVTVTGTLTVQDPDPGNRVLTGTLVSNAPGSNCATGTTDPLCTARLPVLVPRLSITKSAGTTSVVPGGTAGFTIAIANTGETTYTGATVTDTLAGLLDDATYNGDATATTGTLASAGAALTWTGTLAPGAQATITYSVTATRPALGDKTMVNTVSSTAVGSTCPPASGSTACRAVVLVLTPALTLTSTASRATAAPGDTVRYTVVAADTGQTPYAAATFSVPLEGLLDDATFDAGSQTASSGEVRREGATLTWTGALTPGASATVSFSVTVASPVTGNFRLDQSVVSSTQGSTCGPGGGPGCSTSVPISSLRITNRADVATTQPLGVVTFTGVFTNTGQVPYYGISVDDSFVGAGDDAVYGGDATATSGSLVAVPGSGTITWTGDLAVGASVTVTGTVTVRNPDLGDHHVVTVISTTTPGSNCPRGGTDPLCRTDVPVLEPALTAALVADRTVAVPGERVGYTVTLRNTGQTDYAGARVVQTLDGVLDDATYLGDAVASAGTVTVAEGALRWTGNLVQGQTVTVSFGVRVLNPDPGDKAMVSTLVSDEIGSTCPTGSTRSSCTSTVEVLVPALDATVTADRSTTVPGDRVAYTVRITNTGQTVALDAPVRVDLTGVLDDASYAGGATAGTGSVGFTAPALVWRGDLAPGDSTTVSFAVTVGSPPTGDRSLLVLLTTPVAGSGCSAGDGDAGCRSTVPVLIPGLTVTTASSPTTATPGDTVRLTVTVTNTGETAYPAATVTSSLADVLDDATVVGAPTATTGEVDYTAPDLRWTGSLAPGATTTLAVTVRVRPAEQLSADRVLRLTAVSDDAGSTCPAAAGGPACTTTVTVLVPSLAITTTADRATATPGERVGYTVLVTNDGETPQTDVVVRTSLAGLVAEAAYAGDATVTSGGGVLDYTAPVLTWTGTLPVGATARITFSVVVNTPATGDREISTSATSAAPGSSCPVGGTAARCSTAVRVLVPALQITKAASTSTVVAGSTVRYTVTVANTGQTTYAPATFRDDLAGVLDDADYAGDATATSGTLAYADGTLTWSGPLAVGASATVTYSVTARFPATGDRTLRNTAVSASPGSGCVAGTTRARCRSEVAVLVPALTLGKTVSATSVVTGASLAYTVTATNTGQADYAAASFSDDLSGVLDDATYTGGASASQGSVRYAAGRLTWEGLLPRGATVVVTYSVTVDTRPGRGDARLVNVVTSPSVGSTCVPGGAAPACTTTTPVEADVLSLSGLTPSFRLVGAPGDRVEETGAVSLTVTTNSNAGYTVSVRAQSDRLTAPGTDDTIPVDRLAVRPSGDDPGPYTALDPTRSVPVHSQDRASAPGGDAVSNDYRVDIPFVDSGEYGTTVEYVVTAQ